MLFCGGIAAAIGAIVGNESAVVFLYVGGAMGGAMLGAMLGRRWRDDRRGSC